MRLSQTLTRSIEADVLGTMKRSIFAQAGTEIALGTGVSETVPRLSRDCDGVLVFDESDAFDGWATTLKQLNCLALRPDQVSCMPVVAILSDRFADPIGLCATLPPSLPKILVASNVDFELRRAAARAGIDAIIARPFEMGVLSDWLDQFKVPDSLEALKILLVDDDAFTAELHGTVLGQDGMAIRSVTKASDVFNVLDVWLPDLILMDVRMPDVDGIELSRMIRQSREYLSIPIAFLSAESDERKKMDARRWGGDVFISKPVDLKQLAAQIRIRGERARAMRSLMERDSLTGLLNHGRFHERVMAEVERSRRTGTTVTLVMLDLDHFKRVNDTYGHPAGDKVLRALSRALVARLRTIDVVGRYGGEEFGVLLLDTNAESGRRVIDEIRETFAKMVFESEVGEFSVTFSAGVATSGKGDAAQLFFEADRSLYDAKRSGRNCVVLASSV